MGIRKRSHTVSERIRSHLSEQMSLDLMSQLIESDSQRTAPSAASKKIHPGITQFFSPPSSPLCSVSPSVPVNSYSSTNEPPTFHPQKTQRSQLSEQKSVEDFFSQLEESDSSQPSEEKSLEDIISQFIDRESLSFNGGLHTMNQLLTPPSPQMSEQKSVVDIMSQLRERLRLCAAPSAASEKIHAVPAQRVRPLSVSMNEPLSFHPQETQSPQMSEQKSVADVVSRLKERLRSARRSVSPSVSVKSEPSICEPPDSHLKKTQSEPLRETDSTVSHVSMKSNSSMYGPLSFNLKRKQSEPLRETDSTVSHCSMKSESSMYEPHNFNLKKTQSCSVCEEAVKDPVRLLCGHWACKQCVCSHWDQYGSTVDYPCKKCGKRSERNQDLWSVLLEKRIKRVETETEKLQAEKEKIQAEKEKIQAEKEKFDLEKRKLALEIQLLEQQGEYTNYDHGVYIPNKGITYIPYM